MVNSEGPFFENDPLIVIASNRGPFSFKMSDNGSLDAKRGTGGLVTALAALASQHDVLWIAAALSKGDKEWIKQHEDDVNEVEGICLRLLKLEKKRYRQYYNVISNPLLWFVQHQLWDASRKPSITDDIWKAWHEGYVPVNQRFAEAIAESIKDAKKDRPIIVLPQDYQLYLVPQFLRELVGDRVQIQPFIHIPWPGPDAWRILPGEMRVTILSGLLASDRIGFQTRQDAFNFAQTCRVYLPGAHTRGSRDTVEYQDRKIQARAYPISIDVDQVQALGQEPQTRLLKSQLMNFIGDQKLILRVDRVEPSKNILRGLEAFRMLLNQHPECRGQVQLLELLVPSRLEVDEYQTYLRDVMAEAGMINAEYSDEFWEPVRIVVGNNYHRAIAAMQLYDVLLVNPISDGMNLVAKEGVLVNGRDGVLVLSESAGVYYELGDHALVVSPFDTYSTANALHEALTMPTEDRHQRAEAMRQIVAEGGVRQWFYRQVEDVLRASNNQSKKDSTSSTPETSKSA